MWRCFALAAVLLFAMNGCGNSDPEPTGPAPGTEGGPCYGNKTCDEPLSCVGGYCVPLDGPDVTGDINTTDVITAQDGRFQDATVVDTPGNTNPNEQVPEINVNPNVIDFGTVGSGEIKREDFNIVNTGSATLEVTGFQLGGPAVLSLFHDEESWSASLETLSGISLSNPIVLAPGFAHLMTVEFAPTVPLSMEGKIILFSNDPSKQGKGTKVEIKGNL
jgi:hypothetical protein